MEPEIPYRTSLEQLAPAASVSSTDENEYSTLLHARNELAESIANLDHWSAFSLDTTEMTIKQQVKAHQMAYDILAPIFEALNSAVNDINAKYREKLNNG